MGQPKKRINPLQERALRTYADRWGSNWKLQLRADWKASAIRGVDVSDAQILLGLKEAGHFGTHGLDHWSPR